MVCSGLSTPQPFSFLLSLLSISLFRPSMAKNYRRNIVMYGIRTTRWRGTIDGYFGVFVSSFSSSSSSSSSSSASSSSSSSSSSGC
ncbi:hypothetical protein F4820DRAFT_414708 [Hypoxylon rubiginosum]|uniref:Uncharacterized protein n=1 Tax=Hypoxylon rubiginosum TaxID=110542 RepID=A0ACB9Z812_9PEZI|nr:hypothetical protein F4820DRAFT_414708 [Hypoxylon rubiginosum]